MRISPRSRAIGGANAVAVSYQEIGRESAAAGFTSALTELDAQIVEIQQGLNDLEATIVERSKPIPLNQSLLDELDVLLVELAEFDTAPISATSPQVAAYDQRLEVLQLQINSIQTEIDRDREATLLSQDPVLAQTLDERAQARIRLADLQSRRDQLAIDADLAGSGVTFFAPAETAKPSSVGLYVALGFILGLILGAVLATVLARRNQRFEHRAEPAALLGTTLIADIPNFKEERVSSVLPVVDAPNQRVGRGIPVRVSVDLAAAAMAGSR